MSPHALDGHCNQTVNEHAQLQRLVARWPSWSTHTHARTHTHTHTQCLNLYILRLPTDSHTLTRFRVKYRSTRHLSITHGRWRNECMRVVYAAAQMHARSSVMNPDITECRTAVARVSEGVNVTYSVCCGSCVQCELAAAQRRHCSSFFLHRQRQWDERARETYDASFATVRLRSAAFGFGDGKAKGWTCASCILTVHNY